MTTTATPVTSAVTPSDALRALAAVEQVAADAEKRAAALRTFTAQYRTALLGEDPENDPAETAAFMTDLTFYDRASEAIDEAVYCEKPGTGSTDGGNVRRARRAIATLLTGQIPRHLY